VSLTWLRRQELGRVSAPPTVGAVDAVVLPDGRSRRRSWRLIPAAGQPLAGSDRVILDCRSVVGGEGRTPIIKSRFRAVYDVTDGGLGPRRRRVISSTVSDVSGRQTPSSLPLLASLLAAGPSAETCLRRKGPSAARLSPGGLEITPTMARCTSATVSRNGPSFCTWRGQVDRRTARLGSVTVGLAVVSAGRDH
jgi:hypothetical protein